MNWETLLTLAGFFIAFSAFLYSILSNMEKRLNNKVDNVRGELREVKEDLNNKIDDVKEDIKEVKEELNNKIDMVYREIEEVKSDIKEVRSYVVFGHIKARASNE